MKTLVTKRASLTLLLLVAAVALLASSQNWVTFHLDIEATASTPTLELSGNALAPLSFALSLAALAGVGALTIANRSLRYIVLTAIAACGLGIGIVAISVAANPVAFAQSALTETTGLAGIGTLKSHVQSITVSAWVVVTGLAAVFLVILAAFTLVTSHMWANVRTKYDVQSPRSSSNEQPNIASKPGVSDGLADDRISDWDALSHGDDPSETPPNTGTTKPHRFD